MSPDPSGGDADCLSLAVAFSRAPSRFPDLLHGRSPLPHGVTALLQFAAGSPSGNSAAPHPDARSAEHKQAARFFIEQVLLAHHADHYRVLGVAPLAHLDQIKEHHRLLIRLFHPDRQKLPDARTDAFATRINQAYNILRSPDKRAAYDCMMREKLAAKPQSKGPWRQRYITPAAELPMHPPSLVTRHRTIFALGGVALVAALGVLLAYINQVPVGAIGTRSSEPVTRNSDAGVSHALHPELPPAVVRALAESGAVSSSRHDVLPSGSDKPYETAIQIGENRAVPEPAIMPPSVKAPGVILPHSSQDIPARLPVPKQASEAMQAGVGQDLASTPAASATENKAEPLRPEQLNGLVGSFTEQYQRGDLESLLALFDAAARTERGDKKQIRAEYGELFRNSESRILYIWDMAWSADGRVTRGEGNYQARVIQRGDRSPRIYNGTVIFEVIQRDNRLLITGLYHQTDR